jgi:hypothetical protein
MVNIIDKIEEFMKQFTECCAKGDIIRAKKLLNEKKEIGEGSFLGMFGTIRLAVGGPIINEGFELACLNGHMDVARWIYYEVGGIDLNKGNGEAFITTCRNGHLDIAVWLCEICKNYSLDYDPLTERITPIIIKRSNTKKLNIHIA